MNIYCVELVGTMRFSIHHKLGKIKGDYVEKLHEWIKSDDAIRNEIALEGVNLGMYSRWFTRLDHAIEQAKNDAYLCDIVCAAVSTVECDVVGDPMNHPPVCIRDTQFFWRANHSDYWEFGLRNGGAK